METTKLAIEVKAGLLPGGPPEPEFLKVFTIQSSEWQKAQEEGGRATADLLAETVGKAQGYAAMLMNCPHRLNWVRTDWVWF